MVSKTATYFFTQFFNQPHQCTLLVSRDHRVIASVDNVEFFCTDEANGQSLLSEKLWGDEDNVQRVNALMQHIWQSDDKEEQNLIVHARQGGIPYYLKGRQVEIEATTYAVIHVLPLNDDAALSTVLEMHEGEMLSLMNNAGLGIILADPNQQVLFANEVVESFLEFNTGTLSGKSLREVNHADDWEEQDELIQQAESGEKSNFTLEKRYITATGGDKWVREVTTVIRTGGKVKYYLKSVMDITEYKVTQNELEEQKEMYEALFNQAPVGIVVHQNNRVRFANKETLRMINCDSFEKLKGRHIRDFIHPRDKPQVRKRIHDMIEDNRVVKLTEERLITMDGKVVNAVGNASRVKYYGEPAVQAIFNDITEKKRIEAKLWKEKEKSEQYLNVASALIVVLNADGTIDRINRKGETVLGYSQEELIGKDWFNLLAPPEFSDRYRKKFTNAMDKVENPSYNEGLVVTKSGRQRIIGWHSSVFRDTANDSKQLIISGQDITDQKKIEQERLELIKKQERHNKDLQEFTYVVSHNLRSPVSSIMSLVDMIKAHTNGNAELLKTIERLHATVRELDIVIQDLGEILVARKGGADPATVVYLDEVAESIVQVLQPEIDATQARVQFEFDELSSIYGIRSYLTNILFNLVQNAIKFKHNNTRPEVKVRGYRQNGSVVIAVEDNGMGIEKGEVGASVFELNQRFHAHKEGRGMGLYLVKSQVEAMNGRIDFESQVGKGTKFYVTLPAQEV